MSLCSRKRTRANNVVDPTAKQQFKVQSLLDFARSEPQTPPLQSGTSTPKVIVIDESDVQQVNVNDKWFARSDRGRQSSSQSSRTDAAPKSLLASDEEAVSGTR
ncbi:MAG: hypothetical protein M1835_003974 [Candelina submexicana]|nr:MAG: hypothetical protein M1835_003974 [Candelina submexicana]